jgi:Flp pilus assembly protein TadD
MSLRIQRHFWVTIFFVLVLTGGLKAQIAGGLNETTRTDFGGSSFITGSIFFPSGSPINFKIRIRLSSITSGEVIATSDDTGKFVFSKLSVGTYIITIDEQEFEPVTQQIEIQQNRDVQTISFRLTLKATAGQRAQFINVENAGVPKKALEFYKKAILLSKAGDHTGSIDQLKQAINVYPPFLFALTEMGVQYLILGDLAKADEALIAALRIKPGIFEPLVNRGIVYFRLKRYMEAEGLLRAALKAKEHSSVGHYYLGRTLMSLKRLDDAEKEFTAAVAVGGEDVKEAHRMLAFIYLVKKDKKLAAAELDAYLKANPGARDAEQLQATLKQLNSAEKTHPAAPPKP